MEIKRLITEKTQYALTFIRSYKPIYWINNFCMNSFEKAIKKSELLKFALGLDEYFIMDREYGEHWVLGAWQSHILPYAASVPEPEAAGSIPS
jgi:hypothetical protein